MIDRDKIWTGSLNDEAVDTVPFQKVGRVGLYDTTLRDGEQTVGVVLDPETKLAVEPYSSELVSAKREIVLGKRSGIDSIRIRLAELGLDVPEEQFAELLSSVKELGASQHRLVRDDELRQLAGLA